MERIRILSLDGGGMRGIITARILQEVEAILGAPLNQHFDLIAGTSTGSLIAAGIAVGMSTQQLIDIYKNDGLTIFPYQSLFSPARLPLMIQYGPSAPKFFNTGLKRVVQRHIGTDAQGRSRYLADVRPQNGCPLLLITSYDTHSRSAVIFKSWRDEKWYNLPHILNEETREREKLALWQACVSSASAPTFFPALRVDATLDNGTPHEYSLVDGGVCANNPAACAVAEAIRLLCNPHQPRPARSAADAIHHIKLLSIGTGDLANKLPWRQVRGWGLLQWGLKIADVLMDAPSDIYDYISRQIIAEVISQEEVDRKYLRLQLDRPTLAAINPKLLDIQMDDARLETLTCMEAAAETYITSNDIRLVMSTGEVRYVPVNALLKTFLSHWSD